MKSSFQYHLETVSAIHSRHSVPRLFNSQGAALDFAFLDEDEPKLRALRSYAELIQHFELENLDFGDSRSLLQSALAKMNLRLPTGALESVQSSDYIEIYSQDMIPMFRSPNFWETSSYELTDIFSTNYSDLYGRSEFHEAAILRSARKIMTAQPSLIVNPVPSHIAWEKHGPRKCEIHYKLFATAFDGDSGAIAGALVVCDLTPISN